jgi:hypothetical protein
VGTCPARGYRCYSRDTNGVLAMSLQSHFNRVRTLHRKLFPPPKQEVWLPSGVLLDEDENLLPGQEEVWQRCERVGIIPNIYIGFNPDDDGSETA